jgi:hypothetical protein
VAEFAASFQFPYYFGENWPAFDECINDLSWLHHAAGATPNPQTRPLLPEAAPFHTILQSENSGGVIASRMERAGVECEILAFSS